MAKMTATAAVIAAILVAFGASAAAESGDVVLEAPAASSHVHSTSPVISGAIREAAERSATFRALIQTINGSDSYVFVIEGLCRYAVRACFVNVRSSGLTRFMFVYINLHGKTDCDLMTSIGHELRHTIEVIGEPSVRTDADKYFFYQRIGRQSVGGARETLAAMDAGAAVRAEIEEFNRQAKNKRFLIVPSRIAAKPFE